MLCLAGCGLLANYWKPACCFAPINSKLISAGHALPISTGEQQPQQLQCIARLKVVTTAFLAAVAYTYRRRERWRRR